MTLKYKMFASTFTFTKCDIVLVKKRVECK